MGIESTATLYALSIKGGYYDNFGGITELLTEAHLFLTRREAIEFREKFDSSHRVDRSVLLQIIVFISEIEE